MKMLRISNSTKPTPQAMVEQTDQFLICSTIAWGVGFVELLILSIFIH